MKMLLSLGCLLLILYWIPIGDFNLDDLQKDSITISVQGEVKENKILEMNKYSTLQDVLDCVELTNSADISSMNPMMILKDLDVIVIPKISEQQKISINYASFEELLLIPGIGETKALKIIEYRNTYGLFQSLEDLMKIEGFKQKTFDKLKDYICL